MLALTRFPKSAAFLKDERLRKVAKARLDKRLHGKKGILLDISFGGTTQARSVTLGPKGDIKQVPTALPFKLPNTCVHTAVVTHVLEFLNPERYFEWWNDLHRVMLKDGIVYVSGPYGGDESQGWLSDPTHRIRIVEQSFAWLDPQTPFYALHEARGRKTPLPWKTLTVARVPGAHGTVTYNVTMQAVK
jgi:hypothetical protein